MIYQFKPQAHHSFGLPYGLRVRTIGKPDPLGRIRCRDLSGRLLGLLPFNALERL